MYHPRPPSSYGYSDSWQYNQSNSMFLSPPPPPPITSSFHDNHHNITNDYLPEPLPDSYDNYSQSELANYEPSAPPRVPFFPQQHRPPPAAQKKEPMLPAHSNFLQNLSMSSHWPPSGVHSHNGAPSKNSYIPEAQHNFPASSFHGSTNLGSTHYPRGGNSNYPARGNFKRKFTPADQPKFKDKNASNWADNRRPAPIKIDPNWPPELVKMFDTNKCALCDVSLNSRDQSATHYSGRKHQVKVRRYLGEIPEPSDTSKVIQQTEAMVESLPKKPKLDASNPTDPVILTNAKDVTQLYCKICDLSFTSEKHSLQHYMGRNHQRILHGLKPLKDGYYNKETGKWQREPVDPRVTAERLLGVTESGILTGEAIEPETTKERGKFFCEICAVTTTSQDQLNVHLSGQRHKKAVSAKALNDVTGSAATSATTVQPGNISSEETSKKWKEQDLKLFRTPSGNYYCSTCNLQLNSEVQFQQHMESKKHKSKKG